jgi:hypothetical protein
MLYTGEASFRQSRGMTGQREVAHGAFIFIRASGLSHRILPLSNA